MSVVLQWLQEDLTPQVKVCLTTASVSSSQKLVNPNTVIIDSMKLIWVPQHTIDLSEFPVPQEWVDIPSWVGDYYLVVQIEAEDG